MQEELNINVKYRTLNSDLGGGDKSDIKKTFHVVEESLVCRGNQMDNWIPDCLLNIYDSE